MRTSLYNRLCSISQLFSYQRRYIGMFRKMQNLLNEDHYRQNLSANVLFGLLQGGAFGSLSSSTIQTYGYLLYVPVVFLSAAFLGFSLEPYLNRKKSKTLHFGLVSLIILVFPFASPNLLWLILPPILLGSLARPQKNVVYALLQAIGFYIGSITPQATYIVLLFPLLSRFTHSPLIPKQNWIENFNTLGKGLGIGILFLILYIYQWPLTHIQPNDLSILTCICIVFFSINRKTSLKTPTTLLASITIFWLTLGPLSIMERSSNSGDIILLASLLILIIFIFIYWKDSPFSYLGVCISLSSIWFLSSEYDLPILLLIVSIFCIIFQDTTRHKIFQSITTIVIIFIIFTNRKPSFIHKPISLYSPYSPGISNSIQVPKWDRNGWYFLTSQITNLSLNVTDQSKEVILIEGIEFTENNKNSKSENEFALQIEYLAEQMGQVIVIGDIYGHVTYGFQHQAIDTLQISTPIPALTKYLAQKHADKRISWLAPNASLRPLHAEEVIRTTDQQDVIAEVIHIPWASPISSTLSNEHFQKISSTIKPNGLAAFLIHLHEIPEYGLLPITERIEANFGHVQYWLPTGHVDSLFIFAKNTPFSFSLFKEKVFNQKRNPYDIGGQAIANTLPKPSNYADISPRQKVTTPVLHLGPLSEHIDSTSEIWTDLTEEDTLLLNDKIRENKRYLEILHQATQGNMDDVFKRVTTELQESPEKLAKLVEPHLKSAKNEISIALKEGQGSTHWSQANKYALTAQMINPKSVEPWLLLGEIAIGEGFLDKAEEKFQKAIELEPNNLQALHGMARISGLKEDFDTTAEYLIKARSSNPQNWIAHHNLGVFYLQQQKTEDAETALRKAINLKDGDNPKTRIALTEVYIDKEEFTRALVEIERTIQFKPGAYAWYLRGRIHFELKQWTKAEEDFRRATLEDPKFHSARGAIGLIKIAQGDLEGAAQAFRATLRFDPNNKIARQNLSLVEQELAK
jgi:tetratricopeptide (TPR) repeat protein